jgi:hypothetical protein
MRRLALLAAAFVALGAVDAAVAKGPTAATIDGPGTGGGISLGNGADGGVVGSAQFADQAGFFPAAFRQTPDPMLESSPSSELGPRYTVTYVLPGPGGSEDRLLQDLYPYASGGPVTYTKPGQSFFGTQRTRGGWYDAPPALKDTLVRIGLPATAPTTGAGDDGGSGLGDLWPVLTLALGLGLAALAAAVAVRRRPRTAST